MTKGTAFVGILIALAAGYFIGGYMQDRNKPLTTIPTAALPDPSVDRYQVPVGTAPVKGGDRAKVTILEYSDFQCPFCSRVEPTVDQIMKTYGRDVRVAWKNN